MSQTILIEPHQDLRKIYNLNLVTYTGTNVIERSSADDAIELLSILPNIDLIITRNEIGDEETAVKLSEYIESKELDIPLIVIGKKNELEEVAVIHRDDKNWEDLIQKAAKLLGVTEEDQVKIIRPDYTPVKIFYFYDIDHTPCDVYIRIKKSPKEYQFVKRIHAQDKIKQDEIDKYIKQGLQEFHIKKDYQQYFVTFVTNTLMQKLEMDLDIDERIFTNASAFEITRNHVLADDFTEEIEELAYACIKSMVQSIQESPSLANLLQVLFSSKISYAYQKAHLTCLIGNFIISKQKWYEERHLLLFTYLAFLSDITLKSLEQLSINSLDDLEKSNLSPEDKLDVMHHAEDASKLVKSFQGGSEYLEQLVKQHQGSLDGIGFPETFPDTIHPMSRVFITADAFVKILLDPKGPKNKKEILTILYAKFEEENFQKIIKVLEQKIR